MPGQAQSKTTKSLRKGDRIHYFTENRIAKCKSKKVRRMLIVMERSLRLQKAGGVVGGRGGIVPRR